MHQADGSQTQDVRHGGYGGSLSTITLEKDEQIVRVEVKKNGVLIDKITFITRNSKGKKIRHGPFKTTGKTPFTWWMVILWFFWSIW